MGCVSIVDYGRGNLGSLINAFSHLNVSCDIVSDPKALLAAEHIVLPGVGAFSPAMKILRESGLAECLEEAVLAKGSKVLGICLGFQLLCESSTENGFCQGLGLVPGHITRFDEGTRKRIPHIGFNNVTFDHDHKFYSGLDEFNDFYFLHSYRLQGLTEIGSLGLCTYGEDFVASYAINNIYGVQFHPEKSQTNGMRILSNFMES